MHDKSRRVLLFILLGFSISEFAITMDALCAINDSQQDISYNIEVYSIDGLPVQSLSNTKISPDYSISDVEKNIYSGNIWSIFIFSGKNYQNINMNLLRNYLHEKHRKKITICGIGDSVHILANMGFLHGRKCSIHRDWMQYFRTKNPDTIVSDTFYSFDDGIYTCVGGSAVVDFIFNMIQNEDESCMINYACDQIIVDRLRCSDDRQCNASLYLTGSVSKIVSAAIYIMENNIEIPLSLSELCEKLSRSRRQIERLFANELGCSPAKYYMKLRLERARYLIQRTDMQLSEVGYTCGFVSPSHFAKCYREIYKCTPHQERSNWNGYWLDESFHEPHLDPAFIHHIPIEPLSP